MARTVTNTMALDTTAIPEVSFGRLRPPPGKNPESCSGDCGKKIAAPPLSRTPVCTEPKTRLLTSANGSGAREWSVVSGEAAIGLPEYRHRMRSWDVHGIPPPVPPLRAKGGGDQPGIMADGGTDGTEARGALPPVPPIVGPVSCQRCPIEFDATFPRGGTRRSLRRLTTTRGIVADARKPDLLPGRIMARGTAVYSCPSPLLAATCTAGATSHRRHASDKSGFVPSLLTNAVDTAVAGFGVAACRGEIARPPPRRLDKCGLLMEGGLGAVCQRRPVPIGWGAAPSTAAAP